MKTAIAIFAKTVGMSAVKTRLAAEIGTEAAEEFYSLSTACVAQYVQDACSRHCDQLFPVWALAEKEGPGQFSDFGFDAMWTGTGGLGLRMARVSEKLFSFADAVILIGTDSPQLSGDVLIEAAGTLQGCENKCVTGPAADGGFYLFGSTQPVPHSIWEGVEYSRDTTLDDLKVLLEKSGRTVADLPVCQDVDTVCDLASLYDNLCDRREQLLPAQNRLVSWLENNRNYFEVAV